MVTVALLVRIEAKPGQERVDARMRRRALDSHAGPNSNSKDTNMTATGLEVFDDTLHKTNTWLKEIAQELSVDRHGAYQLLRAVLMRIWLWTEPIWIIGYLRIGRRIAFVALFLVACTTMAMAQTNSDDSKRNDSAGHSTSSASRDNKGQPQPQGSPGPLTTGSGGASASDPQGGTPPGMQVDRGDELKAVLPNVKAGGIYTTC